MAEGCGPQRMLGAARDAGEGGAWAREGPAPSLSPPPLPGAQEDGGRFVLREGPGESKEPSEDKQAGDSSKQLLPFFLLLLPF